MRPVLLKQLVKTLRVIANSEGSTNLDELANALNVGVRRVREILKVLSELRLVSIENDRVMITNDGTRFLQAYESRNAELLHKFLFRLRPYSLVYSYYVKGITKPKELHAITGLNIVVIDCVIRMIREIESLKTCSKSSSISNELMSKEDAADSKLLHFVKGIISAYEDIVQQHKCKYVPIHELKSRLCRSLGLTESEFNRLFTEFVSRYREYVTLVPAPLYTTSVKAFDLGGKKYAYIMIDSRVRELC